MKTIHVTANVKIPKVPNFLILEDGQKIPVSAVSNEGLRAIGAEWIDDLIKNAERQRAR